MSYARLGRALRKDSTKTLAGLAILLGFATPLRAAEPLPRLKGDTPIRDPSVIEVEGKYAAFGAGEQGIYRGAIRVKTSSDGVN